MHLYVPVIGRPAGHGERPRDAVRAGLWGQEVPHVGDIHAEVMHRALPLLLHPTSGVRLCSAPHEAAGPARRCGGALRSGGLLDDPSPLQLCLSVPTAEVHSSNPWKHLLHPCMALFTSIYLPYIGKGCNGRILRYVISKNNSLILAGSCSAS